MYELLLAGGVFLWIVVAVIYARSGVASVFHPATYYMFFHGFIFVVRPIVAYLNDFHFVYNIYRFTPDLDDKITALLVADVGFICFMTAVLRFGRHPLVLAATSQLRNDPQRRFRQHLLVTAALLGPIGIYGLFYVLRGIDSGEVVGMALDKATGTMISTSGNGYFFTAGDIAGALAVLIAWQFRFRLIALLPFAAYFAMRVESGMRWTFLLTSAAMGLFWLYDRRYKWPTFRIAIVGAISLGLFTVIGEQRDVVQAWISGKEVSNQIFQNKFLEGMDYANLEYLEYLVRAIPERTGTYGYFVDNLQALTEPIPRVLWSGKPIGAPIQMWDLYRYGSPVGITYSMPGEGWDQLGYLGVAIWCGLWGMIMGSFYNWFARGRQSDYHVAVYLLLLPLTVQIFRDGSLLSALKFPMWFLITIFVWRLVIKLFGGFNGKTHEENRQRALQSHSAAIKFGGVDSRARSPSRHA